jgi:uncharacterized protein (DUF1697 family)
MPIHVALLRGINVGTAKRVAMADLRDLLEKLGYQDVRTLLNSGNAVFTATTAGAKTAGTRIEQALVKRLGVASRVIVFSASELSAVVAGNSLAKIATNPSRLMVAFLATPGDGARLAPIASKRWGAEKIAMGPRAAYFWCPEGIIKSEVAAALGKALGEAVTVRNWATVLKLHAVASPRGNEKAR